MISNVIELFYSSKSELKSALAVTLAFTLLLFLADISNLVINNQGEIITLILYIISGYLGMIGIILAGLGIAITILKPDIIPIIEKLEDNDEVNLILSSYYKLAYVVGFQIGYSLVIYILLLSNLNLVNEYFLLIISFFYLFIFFYVIFYIINLMKNSIKLFNIVNICNNTLKMYENIKKDSIEVLIAEIITSENNKEELYSDIKKKITEGKYEYEDAILKYIKSLLNT